LRCQKVKGLKELAYIHQQLNEGDFKVLHAIESGNTFLEDIAAFSRISLEKTNYRIKKLSKFDLIGLNGIKYVLSYYGFDIIALKEMYRRKIIKSIGDQVGYGKESDIYEVLGINDEPYILKIHREGISFKRVLNNRPNMYKRDWFNISTRSALREKEALSRLYPSVSVPKPIGINRHFIVLEKINGGMLKSISLEEPEWFFDKIIDEVRKSYHCGIVHGDLSEYNIMIGDDRVVLIDWPQFIYSKYNMADKLLVKDVERVINYFSRKYSLNKDVDNVLKKVKN